MSILNSHLKVTSIQPSCLIICLTIGAGRRALSLRVTQILKTHATVTKYIAKILIFRKVQIVSWEEFR